MASFMALKDEYEISFVSDRESLAHQDVLRQNGAEIIRVRPRSKAPFGYYRDLRSVLRDTSFDVLWCHQSVLNTLAPVTFARRARVPVRIVHSHATKNLGTRVAALLHPVNKRRVASAANRHFACSAEAARWMFGDLPAVIIPNAFNTAAFSFDPHVRSALRSELDIPDQTLVIAHVARFGEEKNHPLTIEITRAARDQGMQVRTLLIGDGEARGHLEELVRSARLEAHVQLLGLRSDVPALLQASDVLVLPSLHEGLPYSVLEAQAASLPAVVSDRVPTEVDVTHQVSFVPVTASAEVWLREIVKQAARKRVAHQLPLGGTAYDSRGLAVMLRSAIDQDENRETDDYGE